MARRMKNIKKLVICFFLTPTIIFREEVPRNNFLDEISSKGPSANYFNESIYRTTFKLQKKNVSIITSNSNPLYRKSCLVVDFQSDVTNKEIQIHHWSLLENQVILLVTFNFCDVTVKIDD